MEFGYSMILLSKCHGYIYIYMGKNLALLTLPLLTELWAHCVEDFAL